MANLIGTAGHVDHGKTSLIRALTGIDADRLPEEKKRGLTIDIGFAYIDLEGVGRASIVDVPGHERFLTNMLVGAMGMDVVLLCVAADESVMPQTREHFEILELLPVRSLVVALTRSDLADEVLAGIAEEEARELLHGSRFEGSPIVPVSAETGLGLDELRRRLASALSVADAPQEHDWYMPVDRVFVVKGHGAVVTGTLARGVVQSGEACMVAPDGYEARIRSIESHDQRVESSTRGSRTALNLSGVHASDLRRGQIVSAPGVAFATRTVDGTATWHVVPKHASRVRVSIGSDEAIARVFLDADGARLQLRFEREVAAVKGQPFIVRAYSPPRVLGGGTVTVPVAVKGKGSSTAEIAPGGEEEALVAVVAASPDGLDNAELCRLVGKSPQALGDPLERLKESGRLIGLAGTWLTPETYEGVVRRFTTALQSLHEAHPERLAHPREEVVRKAGLLWSGKPLDRLVARLANEGVLRAQGTSVSLAGFQVRLADKQRAMLDRVLAEMARSGISTPDAPTVAESLKVPRQAVEEILRVGLQAGEVTHVAEGYVVPSSVVAQTVERMRAHFADRPFSAAEFRTAFDTSRKYAIPFLEHLDSKGVTLRVGDNRVLK